jgi:pimeloyl-ACP methyl ester carboxylesterase
MLRREILTTAFAAPLIGAAAAARPAQAAAPARRATVIHAKDGTALYHRDWGEGPAIVFAASWACSGEMWAYQVAHFADAGFRCISFDRRGHGRSDAPARGYDMDVFADDLAAVIEGLDLRDIILVGHSQGGAEVVRYLGRHGTSRVRKVALMAPAGPCLLQKPDNPYGAPEAAYDARIAEWRQDFPKWVADNTAPFFTPQTSPAMQAWLADLILETPLPVTVATFQALYQADVRPDLAKIDRPVLIQHGTKDASIPLEIGGRRFAAGIAGAELKVYEGAPHGLFVTHLDQVNRDLEAFIRA